MIEASRRHTYPDNSCIFLENRSSSFQTMMMLDPRHMFSYVTFDIRYSRLSRTWRTPKLCHSATLETTSEGIVEF
jgi:hypothetical protein